jgi:hypothetical protein
MKGVRKMPEWLLFIVIVLVYFALMKWVLPSMGVST